MKIDTLDDEFDQYFARAALGMSGPVTPMNSEPNQPKEEPDNRRGSLPVATLKVINNQYIYYLNDFSYLNML